MKKKLLCLGLNSALLAVLFWLAAASGQAQNKKDDKPKPAQSIPELRQQIAKVLGELQAEG